MSEIIGHRLRQTAEIISSLNIRAYAYGRFEDCDESEQEYEDGTKYVYRPEYFLINGLKERSFQLLFSKAIFDDFARIDIALDNRSVKDAESLRQSLNEDLTAILAELEKKNTELELEVYGNYKSNPGERDELLPKEEFEDVYSVCVEKTHRIFDWIRNRISEKEDYYHFEIEEAESRLPVAFTQAQFILFIKLAETTHLIDFSEWTDPQIRAWLQKNFLFLETSSGTHEPQKLLKLATKLFNDRSSEGQFKRYADADLEKAKEQLELNGNIPKRVVDALETMLQFIKSDLPK